MEMEIKLLKNINRYSQILFVREGQVSQTDLTMVSFHSDSESYIYIAYAFDIR